MRKRADSSNGFILCFIINLLLNFEWLIVALVLLGIHFWLGLPLYFVYIALGIWILSPLGITLFSIFISKTSNEPTPPKENKNPYSFKKQDK